MTKIIIRHSTDLMPADNELIAAGKEQLKKASGFDNIDDNDIEFRAINHADPFQQSYCERVEIIHEGMQLLIDSLSPIDLRKTHENFKKAAQRVFDKVSAEIKNLPDKTNIKAYQKLLIQYVQILEVLLKNVVKLPEDVDPIKLLQDAEEWATACRPRPTICTVTRYDIAKKTEAEAQLGYLVQIDEPLAPLSEEIKQEYLNTQILPSANHPLWFQLLPKAEQAILNQVLRGVVTKEDVALRIPSLPNRLSKVPGVRNFWQHSIRMVRADENCTVVHESSALRSSVISADEVEGNKKDQLAVRKSIADQNLRHIVSLANNHFPDIPNTAILLQSLLSPGASFAPLKFDHELYEDKRQAVARLNEAQDEIELIDTNHPINSMGHLNRTRNSGPNGQAANQLIRRAEAFATQIEGNDPNPEQAQQALYIRSIVAEFTQLLNHNRIFSNGRSREFHGGSYENLLARRLRKDGVFSHSNCASGKDREAQEINSTDSYDIFLYQHGAAPNYENASHHQECRLLHALMFCSGHHQAVASTNAPGSAGIVCPPRYLTRARQQTIKSQAEMDGYPHPEQILDDSDLLANNNNLKKIAKQAKTYGVKDFTKAEQNALCNELFKPEPAVIPDVIQAAHVNAQPFSLLTDIEETKNTFAEQYTLQTEEAERLVFVAQENDVQQPTVEVFSKAIKITNGDTQTCCDAAERLIRIAQSQQGAFPLRLKFTTNSEEKFAEVQRICGNYGVAVYRGGINNGVNPGRGPGLFAPPRAQPVPNLVAPLVNRPGMANG
jgi:hypothetical protein